jgi:hypothetical protein
MAILERRFVSQLGAAGKKKVSSLPFPYTSVLNRQVLKSQGTSAEVKSPFDLAISAGRNLESRWIKHGGMSFIFAKISNYSNGG